ncbi:hypothetical protein OQA88_3640, partial [Cercophora sp. LCS_1]
LGVFYGFYHQRTITTTQRAAAAQRDYEHKQKLIEQAKQAYAKSKQPASAAAAPQPSGGRELFLSSPGSSRVLTQGAVNQDPNDPNFDLGTYIEAFLAQKS